MSAEVLENDVIAKLRKENSRLKARNRDLAAMLNRAMIREFDAFSKCYDAVADLPLNRYLNPRKRYKLGNLIEQLCYSIRSYQLYAFNNRELKVIAKYVGRGEIIEEALKMVPDRRDDTEME